MTHIMRKLGLMAASAVFVGGMLAASAPAMAKDEFSAAQKKAVEGIIYDYLMENPQVIFEATSRMREKAEAEQKYAFERTFEENLNEIFSADTPFIGNPDGDVMIVEFFDYNCGYCHRALRDILKLVEQDKNVKILFKELPILGESSLDAARWSLAAHKQGKFFEFHQQLMKSAGPKSEKQFMKLAKDLGLDAEQMKKDAAGQDVNLQIANNIKLSQKLGIRGTPAFIIGDTLAPGYMGIDNMKMAIADYRENGEKIELDNDKADK